MSSSLSNNNSLSKTNTCDKNKPMCCHFGEDRIATWTIHFLCHPYAMHENERRIGSVRAKRKYKKYQCTAGHENFDYPTTKRKKWSQDAIKMMSNVRII